jgi:hypothetical protein
MLKAANVGKGIGHGKAQKTQKRGSWILQKKTPYTLSSGRLFSALRLGVSAVKRPLHFHFESGGGFR